MTAANYDLNGDSIIEQGSYWSLTIRHPGNLSGASLRGEIRKDFRSQKLQSFRFSPFTYEAETDKSIATMFLNSGQTQLLPIPDPIEVEGLITPGHWLYDVKLIRPGQDPIRLLQGRVYVSPGITDLGD